MTRHACPSDVGNDEEAFVVHDVTVEPSRLIISCSKSSAFGHQIRRQSGSPTHATLRAASTVQFCHWSYQTALVRQPVVEVVPVAGRLAVVEVVPAAVACLAAAEIVNLCVLLGILLLLCCRFAGHMMARCIGNPAYRGGP